MAAYLLTRPIRLRLTHVHTCSEVLFLQSLVLFADLPNPDVSEDSDLSTLTLRV